VLKYNSNLLEHLSVLRVEGSVNYYTEYGHDIYILLNMYINLDYIITKDLSKNCQYIIPRSKI